MPTCSRVIVPPPGTLQQETVMDTIKQKFCATVKGYISEKTRKGWPKSNLDSKEISGMKETKSLIKDKSIVVGKTDKCGKMCADSTENYLDALKVHTEDHVKIDLETAKKIENKMNDHVEHVKEKNINEKDI